MSRKMFCLSGAVLAVLLMVSGCTAVKLIQSAKIVKPEIKYLSHETGTPTLKSTPVYLKFSAHNPNEIGFKNVFASYELFTEKKRFLKGDNIALTLAPKGDTTIVIPAEIVYEDVARAIGPLAEKLLTGKDALDVDVAIKIYGTPTVYNKYEEGGLFSFEYETTQHLNVPIPHDKVDQAKGRAKEELKKLKKIF